MPSPEPVMRKDAQRTRDRLVTATGELLEASGPDFTLPELARHAGVGTATVYRHFTDTAEAHDEFERYTVNGLVEIIEDLPVDLPAREYFRRICVAWVRRSQDEVAAARFIRSPQGFLERSGNEEPPLHTLAGDLRSALGKLVDAELIPDQDLDIAALLWVTLFDERVVVDLTRSRGWDAAKIAGFLATSLLGALQNPSGGAFSG